VKEFIGCNLYFTKETISVFSDENPLNLVEYKVFSDKDISVGTITEIIENPGQLLLKIISGTGKNILLPLHEDLIREIDSENKIIRMIIPDGISDIN
jgi:16S rRNA processing protein RimM